MRLDTASGYRSFSVVDDATGKEVMFVLWVDDTALEYAVIAEPLRFDWDTLQPAEDVITVSRVAVDHVNQVIHLNDAPVVMASSLEVRELHKCDACRQEETCRRIDYCAQYRCRFGEAKKP